MRRVVVTGLGIVSSIGVGKDAVTASLREGRSGISFNTGYAELGMRSQVSGEIDLDIEERIERKKRRFMGAAAAYNYVAMDEALADSGLSAEEIRSPEVGLITGSGGGSPQNIVQAADLLRERGIRRVGPYMVPRTMASTTSAVLGTLFGIQGTSYSISSACSTSAHCIGHAADLIHLGRHHTVFAGGGEEVHWTMSVLFDGMGAMSSKYNDAPETSSRAYDRDRDGFVISGKTAVEEEECVLGLNRRRVHLELSHRQGRGKKRIPVSTRNRGFYRHQIAELPTVFQLLGMSVTRVVDQQTIIQP